MTSPLKFQGTHTSIKQDEEKISKSFSVIPKPCFSEDSVSPPFPAYTLNPFPLVMYIMILDNIRRFHDFFLSFLLVYQ